MSLWRPELKPGRFTDFSFRTGRVVYLASSPTLNRPNIPNKMSRDAAHKEQTLKALYAELNKLGQNGEYEKAIKTANKSE